MKVFLIVLAILIGLFAVTAVLFVGYGREKSWERLAGPPDGGRIDLVSVQRSSTANDAMAATAGLRPDADIVLPVFGGPPAALMSQIARQIEANDWLARRVDNGEDPFHMRYVTYSPTMRFPDLVSFEAISLGDGQIGLIAYARAQLGRFDFGANRRRLELYLATVDATPQSPAVAAPALN